MAILPDDTALGGLPSANSGRQVATYDATGVARGMAAQAESIAKVGALEAQGAQQFGKGIEKAAEDVSYIQQYQQKVQDQIYVQSHQVSMAPAVLQAQYDARQAHPDGGPEYMQDLDTRLQQAKNGVTTYLAQRGFQPSQVAQQHVDTQFAGMRASALTNGVSFSNDQKVASLQTTLNDNVDLIKSQVLAGNMSIDDALKSVEDNAVTGKPMWGGAQLVAQKDKWQQGVVDAAIENKFKAGDIAGGLAIRDKYYGATPRWGDSQAAGVARVANNLGIAPRDLAAVMSYETGGRFDPNMMGGKGGNYQGLIQFGPEERAKYGVKPGQTFQEQLPAVENFLRDRGIKPGMNLAQIYSVVNAGSLDQNGQPRWAASDGNGNVASHVQQIQLEHYGSADRFLANGHPLTKVASADSSVLPGAGAPNADASGDTSSNSSGDNAPILPNAVKSLYWDTQAQHAGTDLERQDRVQKIQIQKASDNAETTYLQDLYTDQPKSTIRGIVNDPVLTREAKERMIGVATRALKDEPLSQVSQQTTTQLLDRIRKPDGDPQKITDLQPIYDALIAGRLNKADFQFLRKEQQDLQTPDGEKIGKKKAEFIKGVTSSITKSNPLMGKIDQSGDQQLYNLEWDVDKRIADARKAGKNPFDLFDPASSDFLGSPKALEPYQKTLQQSLTDRVKQLAVPGTAIAPADQATPPPRPQEPRKPGESPADYLKRIGSK